MAKKSSPGFYIVPRDRGLTIGFAGTDYGTRLDALASRTISFAQFDGRHVNSYREINASFEDANEGIGSPVLPEGGRGRSSRDRISDLLEKPEPPIRSQMRRVA